MVYKQVDGHICNVNIDMDFINEHAALTHGMEVTNIEANGIHKQIYSSAVKEYDIVYSLWTMYRWLYYNREKIIGMVPFTITGTESKYKREFTLTSLIM